MTSSSLAIVLHGPRTKNGRKVFDSFKMANQASFWNRELVAAADSLIYMGFMRPGTLFVSAPPLHLSSLKSAWARRVLKPADGYRIESLGDMGVIQPVEQMHFVPLGDVLCDAIAQLNRQGQTANVQTIRSHVAANSAHVAAPSVEMVRQTVASLAATGLIYRMGEHLFVSVPAQSPPKQHKQTVECQTGQSIIEPKEKESARRGILARLFSRRPPALPQKTNQPMAFSTEFPPPQWMNRDWTKDNKQQQQQHQQITQIKYPTFPDRLCDEAPASTRRPRRQRKCERRPLSSSSECLNYGPIDPPECLPVNLEVLDDSRTRRSRRRTTTAPRRRPVRTSTPVGGTDSAYSPSPVTDSNEEPGEGSWSEPEGVKIDHTYVNLNHDESTQFEEFSSSQPSLPVSRVHISNV